MRKLYVEARNRTTSSQRLHELAALKDTSVLEAVAANPSTGEATLELLSNSSNVRIRSIVAGHSNTSLSTLQAIALEPDVAFIVYEGPLEPSWQNSIYESLIRALQGRPDDKERLQSLIHIENTFVTNAQKTLGDTVQELLVIHSVERVSSLSPSKQIEYINRKGGLCTECLNALAKEGEREVRLAIATLKRSFESAFHILATDPVLEIRMAIAQNPWTPSAVLSSLWALYGSSGAIAKSLSTHRHASEAVIEDIVFKGVDREVLMRASSHKALNEKSQRHLLQGGDYSYHLAGNQSCLPDILDTLSKSDSASLRGIIAYNPSAGTDTLIHLSEDSDVQVRQAVASRPYPPKDKATPLPNSVYARLRQDPSLEVREKLLSRHRNRWSKSEQQQFKLEITELKKTLLLKGHPDFPGSRGPRRRRNINLDLVRSLCESNPPLTEAELANMVAEHELFISIDGGTGTWSHNSVANLPLTLYLNRKETEAKQMFLRNKIIAVGTSLAGQKLQYANLTGACCEEIELSNACLEGSVLTDGLWSRTIFDGADLRGTDFSGSQLRGASFVGANLSNADFQQSDCTGADFSGAILKNSRWGSAILDDIIR